MFTSASFDSLMMSKNKHDRTLCIHGPLTRYVKLRVAHAPGMPGTFSCITDVRDARAVMHVGIANTRCAGKMFPAFPADAQPAMLRIWQDAHDLPYINNTQCTHGTAKAKPNKFGINFFNYLTHHIEYIISPSVCLSNATRVSELSMPMEAECQKQRFWDRGIKTTVTSWIFLTNTQTKSEVSLVKSTLGKLNKIVAGYI